MKSTYWSVALLFVGLVAGYLVGTGSGDRLANAQAPAAPGGGRYQLSSWGSHGDHGCYILDTVSGEVWQVTGYNPQRAKKVTEKLH